MNLIPPELLYAPSHEWLRRESDGTVTIGLTDFAQAALGDITFVQLPAQGARLAAGQQLGVVESVKAASDIYAPVSGEVVARNVALESDPSALNRAPYTDGWLVRVKPEGAAPWAKLLGAEAYRQIAQ